MRKIEEKEKEEEDHNGVKKKSSQNLLREKIMKLHFPESLKVYLTYFREK